MENSPLRSWRRSWRAEVGELSAWAQASASRRLVIGFCLPAHAPLAPDPELLLLEFGKDFEPLGVPLVQLGSKLAFIVQARLALAVSGADGRLDVEDVGNLIPGVVGLDDGDRLGVDGRDREGAILCGAVRPGEGREYMRGQWCRDGPDDVADSPVNAPSKELQAGPEGACRKVGFQSVND